MRISFRTPHIGLNLFPKVPFHNILMLHEVTHSIIIKITSFERYASYNKSWINDHSIWSYAFSRSILITIITFSSQSLMGCNTFWVITILSVIWGSGTKLSYAATIIYLPHYRFEVIHYCLCNDFTRDCTQVDWSQLNEDL